MNFFIYILLLLLLSREQLIFWKGFKKSTFVKTQCGTLNENFQRIKRVKKTSNFPKKNLKFSKENFETFQRNFVKET